MLRAFPGYDLQGTDVRSKCFSQQLWYGWYGVMITKGRSLFVADEGGGSRTFWVCKTLCGLPFGWTCHKPLHLFTLK